MESLKEMVRALAGPLEAETRGGYGDRAVIGQSIGEYARGWGERTRKAVRGRAARELCGRICEVLGDYGECDVEGRRERVEEAQRLLEGLGTDGRNVQGGRKRRDSSIWMSR